MKSQIMMIATATLALVSFAAETDTAISTNAPKRKVNVLLRKTGGMIPRPGVKQGVIAILNAQKTVPASEFVAVSKAMGKLLHVGLPVRDVEIRDDKIALAEVFRAEGANYAVFVVDSDRCANALTILPEAKYAIVNINPLRAEGGEGSFLMARTRKEIIRAILFVAGGASSQADGNLMAEIKTAKDLDKLVDSEIPIDVIGRVYSYLPRTGCETRAFSTYFQACKEGWAPAPTNEYQQAIWDKMKSAKERGPKNAIKIPPPNAKK